MILDFSADQESLDPAQGVLKGEDQSDAPDIIIILVPWDPIPLESRGRWAGEELLKGC